MLCGCVSSCCEENTLGWSCVVFYLSLSAQCPAVGYTVAVYVIYKRKYVELRVRTG